MYSWEIKKLIEERGYLLDNETLLKVLSIEDNPQLSHIIYNPYENEYKIWDDEGNYFHCKPKQLVKRKKG